MSHLSSEELVNGYDALMMAIFGFDAYARWKMVKLRTKSSNESAFVGWLLDLAEKDIDKRETTITTKQGPSSRMHAVDRDQGEWTDPDFRPGCESQQVKASGSSSYNAAASVLETGYEDVDCESGSSPVPVAGDGMDHGDVGEEEERAVGGGEGSRESAESEKARMSRHIEHKLISGMLHYVCSFCGGIYPRYNGVRRHIRTVHFNERPYQCNLCQRWFKHAHTRKRHQQKPCRPLTLAFHDRLEAKKGPAEVKHPIDST